MQCIRTIFKIVCLLIDFTHQHLKKLSKCILSLTLV